MRLALVVTTYERPDALAAVLATVLDQSSAPDEVIVADDGSDARTRELVESSRRRMHASLSFVRQEHRGFRLTRLRNLAIAAARSEYIVFVDGDMLLAREFVADHRRHARRGAFVQGVRIPLGTEATRCLLQTPGERPGSAMLAGAGLRRLYALRAPLLQRAFATAGNALIAIKGCNQGFWRDDLVRVNGFDEEIEGWGPEDKELCARLRHAGVRRRTLLAGALAWHLSHAPAPREHAARNRARLERTLALRLVRCEHGLDAHLVL